MMKNTRRGYIDTLLALVFSLMLLANGLLPRMRESLVPYSVPDERETASISSDPQSIIQEIDAAMPPLLVAIERFGHYQDFYTALIAYLQNEIRLQTAIGQNSRAQDMLNAYERHLSLAQAHEASALSTLQSYASIREKALKEETLSEQDTEAIAMLGLVVSQTDADVQQDKRLGAEILVSHDEAFLEKALGEGYSTYELLFAQ
jgi:hypothetical protein